MPYYHHPRGFTPLSVLADRKARKNGLRHAIFTSRFDSYVGDWKCDLKEGKGRFITIGGMLYEGDWYKGYRERRSRADSSTLKGYTRLRWLRESPKGIPWPLATYRQLRQLRQLKEHRHGFGLLSKRHSTNGTYRLVYRGEWVRGKMEGPGWMYFENGDVYLGFFKNNKKCGYGTMWYANNTFYGGYWKNDVRDGLGLFLLENGCRYEGHWEKGIKSGIGRFYHMNTGQLQEGCWIEDICVKSKMSDVIIRQACEHPTPYPIPLHQLKSPKDLLEKSELWMLQKVGDIDKNLKYCIDQM